MKRLPIIVFACLMAMFADAAQSIVIAKTGQGKISINLGSYRTGSDTASKTFLSVLKADLNRSGYFTVTSTGGALTVSGTCTAGGEQLQAECQVFEVATRQRKLGKIYRGSASDPRALAHKIADEIVLAVTGKPGMASAKLALVSNRTGRKELYVCDIDGFNMRQITNDRSIVVGTGWAPDAKAVIYTSYKLGYPNLFVTTQERPVSSNAGMNTSGAISPDGKSMALVLSKDGNPELYLKSMRTGSLTRLTNTSKGNEASPSWSPDGKYIAFVSDITGKPQVYVMPSGGGQAQRVTTTGTENVAPDWGKNNMIACSSRVGGRYQIAVVNPTTRSSTLLETDWADYEDPSWTPDGRHIVCSRSSGGRSGIYLLDTQKDSSVPLVTGSGEWYSPACSP